MYSGSLYGSLDGKEAQPFDRFKFLLEKVTVYYSIQKCTSKHITGGSHVVNKMRLVF